MSGGPTVFQPGHFGPLDQPRAGARILLRVRLRLTNEMDSARAPDEWYDALAAAVREVDYCLSQHPWKG